MRREKKSYTDKTKIFNNNWKLEEKKTDLCWRHSKKITINKSKKKKLDWLKLNLKQNKFLKWEREKASEAEFQLVFICNNNKQKDFIKRKVHLETEWNPQAISKEKALPELGCDRFKFI